MRKRFSKKKGGMPSFGNRSTANRGSRVSPLLPRSQNMFLDPHVSESALPLPLPLALPLALPLERDVIVDIGRDEQPQRLSRGLDPRASEFVLPLPVSQEVVFDIGRDEEQPQQVSSVYNPTASEFVQPPLIRQRQQYEMQQKVLQDDLERDERRGFIEEEEFLPQLRNTGNSVFNHLDLGGKKRKYKYITQRRRRRQKQRRNSRKTRKNKK